MCWSGIWKRREWRPGLEGRGVWLLPNVGGCAGQHADGNVATRDFEDGRGIPGRPAHDRLRRAEDADFVRSVGGKLGEGWGNGEVAVGLDPTHGDGLAVFVHNSDNGTRLESCGVAAERKLRLTVAGREIAVLDRAGAEGGAPGSKALLECAAGPAEPIDRLTPGRASRWTGGWRGVGTHHREGDFAASGGFVDTHALAVRTLDDDFLGVGRRECEKEEADGGGEVVKRWFHCGGFLWGLGYDSGYWPRDSALVELAVQSPALALRTAEA